MCENILILFHLFSLHTWIWCGSVAMPIPDYLPCQYVIRRVYCETYWQRETKRRRKERKREREKEKEKEREGQIGIEREMKGKGERKGGIDREMERKSVCECVWVCVCVRELTHTTEIWLIRELDPTISLSFLPSFKWKPDKTPIDIAIKPKKVKEK